MTQKHEELQNLFLHIFQRDMGSPNTKGWAQNINDLILEPSSRELIRSLSSFSISELLRHASPESLDNLLTILSNEKIRNALSIIPKNIAEIIADKIHSEFLRDRFINLINQSSYFKEELTDHWLSKENNLDDIEKILEGFQANEIRSNELKNHDLLNEIKFLSSQNSDLQKNLSILKNDFEEKTSRINKKYENILKTQENSHLQKIKELEQQYSELIQKRIDENLTKYVNSAVETLNKIEGKLNSSAAVWSIIASVTVITALIVGIGFSLFGYYYGPPINDIKWPELLIISIKGLFIISALTAAATFAFSKSNAYTHEALIVSNRAHAIQFGKLYLEIYGNTVERSEMVKIFENWNISPATAFLKNPNQKNSMDIDKSLDLVKKAKDIINIKD